MEQVLYSKNNVLNNSFSEDNLELLISQIVDYPLKESKINSYSYIKGAEFIMNNLFNLYEKVKNSFCGGGKIYALNQTVNKSVLCGFFKEIKEDLGINYRIFSGGKLDIPVAKKIVDYLVKIDEPSVINFNDFIAGAKKVTKIIEYAYYAPLTKPFKSFIKNESKNIVKNISEKLNRL
jgi:hypothetical protein